LQGHAALQGIGCQEIKIRLQVGGAKMLEPRTFNRRNVDRGRAACAANETVIEEASAVSAFMFMESAITGQKFASVYDTCRAPAGRDSGCGLHEGRRGGFHLRALL
jgi:hypothetical protein